MALGRFRRTQRIEGELRFMRPVVGMRMGFRQILTTAIVSLVVGLLLIGVRGMHAYFE